MLEKLIDAWGKTYNKATAVFSNDLSAAAKAAPAARDELLDVLDPVQKCTPLIAVMENIDKIARMPLDGKGKEAKLLNAVLPKFEAQKKSFIAAVDKAVAARLPGKDKAGLVTVRTLKDLYPDSYRQLKTLRADIEAHYLRAASYVQGLQASEAVDRIDAEKQKVLDRTRDAAAVREAQQVAALKKFLLMLTPQLKTSMAKAGASIQKVKADPTVKAYNSEIQAAAQGINDVLINIGKVRANSALKNVPQMRTMKDPATPQRSLLMFVTGALSRLPDPTSSEDVQDAVKGFSQIWKQTAAYYADLLAGKA